MRDANRKYAAMRSVKYPGNDIGYQGERDELISSHKFSYPGHRASLLHRNIGFCPTVCVGGG
jgi:hypothetical protein